MFNYNLFKRTLPAVISISAACYYNHNKQSTTNLLTTYNLFKLNSFNVTAESTKTINDGGYSDFISNWKNMIYPARPDRSEVLKFLNFLEMLVNGRDVLVLGSTPELRDIACITGKDVTCVDINQNTMNVLRDIGMKYKKIAKFKETLIECDWLQINKNNVLKDKQFDIILSEESINMLPFDKWDSFLDSIYSLLDNNGYLIIKVMVKPPIGYFDDINIEKNIINKWCKSRYGVRNDIGYLFCDILAYVNSCKTDNEYINWNEVLKLVSERSDKYKWMWSNEQKKLFFEKFGAIKDSNFMFYCKTEKEFKELVESKGFFIQDITYGNDDIEKYRFTPIFVIAKQNVYLGGEAAKISDPESEHWWQSKTSTLYKHFGGAGS